jgi:outer membrane receptor protein involved in Fe transport
VGDTSDEAASIEGASTAHTYSVRALGEWRLTRVFALSLLFRYLLYQSPISADTTADSDMVSVDGDLSAESALQKHFTIVPGVSFAWEHWEFNVGVGYGVVYLPLVGLASAKNWPVVDLAFAYRFDIYH